MAAQTKPCWLMDWYPYNLARINKNTTHKKGPE